MCICNYLLDDYVENHRYQAHANAALLFRTFVLVFHVLLYDHCEYLNTLSRNYKVTGHQSSKLNGQCQVNASCRMIGTVSPLLCTFLSRGLKPCQALSLFCPPTLFSGSSAPQLRACTQELSEQCIQVHMPAFAKSSCSKHREQYFAARLIYSTQN